MKKFLIFLFQYLLLMSYLGTSLATDLCANKYTNSVTGAVNQANCPNGYFHINCVCYQNCPSNTVIDQTSTNNDCKCAFKYTVTTGSPDKYNCLNQGEPCPQQNPYFIEENNKCTNTACTGTTPYERKIDTTTGTVNYQCVAKCQSDEVTDDENKKCLKTCIGVEKDGKKYEYYYPDKRECIDQCNANDYTFKEKFTCHRVCETSLNIFNMVSGSSDPKFMCTEKTLCSETAKWHYLFPLTNTCIEKCDDTLDSSINIQTYSYEDSSGVKRCVAACSLTLKPLISRDGKSCTSKCLNSEIIKGGKCDTSCTTYYIVSTNECVDGCPSDYFVDENATLKKCYEKCPDSLYHDYSAKTCKPLAADIYIVYNDQSKILYTACPSAYPYSTPWIDSSRVCFASTKGCNDSNNPKPLYKYSESDSLFVCLDKCSTDGELRTEDYVCIKSSTSASACPPSYPYKSDLTCYKNGCPKATMNYHVNVGTDYYYICYELSSCPHSSLIYIQDGKCVTACNSIEYPFKIEEGTLTNLNPGFCFKSPSECFSHIDTNTNKKFFYYSDTSKKCEDTCSHFKIQTEPGTDHPYAREAGTCISGNCPIDFPYKDETDTTNKVCYKDDCPSSLYINFADYTKTIFSCVACSEASDYKYKRYCTSDCTITPYQFRNGKDCVEKCPETGNKFYLITDKECKSTCANSQAYDPITFECLTSCLNVKGYEFFPYFSTSTEAPKPCQSSCGDNEYYKEVDKKCISACDEGNFLSSSDPKRCTTACEAWEKSETINGKKVCKSNCPSFFYVDGTRTVCFSSFDAMKTTYTSVTVYTNSTKQGLTACPLNENFEIGGVCYTKCPSDSPYYIVPSGTTGSNKCYSNCAAAGATNPYTLENGYQCFDKCPEDRNFIIAGTKNCIKGCTQEYPYYFQKSGETFYTCSANCKEDSTFKYITDNKCTKNCNIDETGYKPYLYLSNNTCLASCPADAKYNKLFTDFKYYICQESCTSVPFLAPNNTCLPKCPDFAPYIGKNSVCKKACDSVIDGRYYSVSDTTGYKTYKCTMNCALANHRFYHYKTFECYQNGCPNTQTYYASPDNICYDICNVDPIYSFSYTKVDGGQTTYECLRKCPEGTYYLSDKICTSNCAGSTTNKTIDENGACVVNCHFDENSEYKYSFIETGGTLSKCYKNCSIASTTKIKYSKTNYICIDTCPTNEPFTRQGGECSSSCDLNSKYKFAYKASNKQDYECMLECPDNAEKKIYYYEDDYICLSECIKDGTKGYVVKGSNRCVKSCEQEPVYKYHYDITQTTNKGYTVNTCVDVCKNDKGLQFSLENNRCGDSCSLANKYYLESNMTCLAQCPENTKINSNSAIPADLNKCVTDCKSSEFLSEKGKCLGQCDTTNGYIYFFEPEHICRQNCGNFYTDGHVCASSCPSGSLSAEAKNYLYADGTTCVETCPNSKKYFVYSFEKGETDIQKKCLTECPANYPFWFQIKDQNNKDVYGCFSSCSKAATASSNTLPNYLSDPDTTIIAKECKGSCSGAFPYIGIDGECIKQCPESAPYYVPGTKQCYKKCPSESSNNFPYHETGSYECKDSCPSTAPKIVYETNECVERCSLNQYWGTKDNKGYCLNACNELFGLLLTPDHQCVAACETSNFNTIYDEAKKACVCKNLYYIDVDTGLPNCLDYQKNICIEAFTSNQISNGKAYKYNIEGTKECTKVCNTIETEDFKCLKPSSSCPENTFLMKYPAGNGICKCKYKYYSNDYGQNTCLGESSDCPAWKKLINQGTKRCQRQCSTDATTDPYQYNLKDTYCVKECPSGFKVGSENKCECKNDAKKWYKKINENGDYDFYCLTPNSKCLADHPFEISGTNECVDKCMNNEEDNNKYYILFGNTCVSTCSEITIDSPGTTILAAIDPKDPLYQYSHYTCLCQDKLWYKDVSEKYGFKCSEKSITAHCFEITVQNFIYQIKETHECVSECPITHPFIFNDECYPSCDKAGSNVVQVGNETRCECKNAWKEEALSSNPIIKIQKCFDSCNDAFQSNGNGGTLRRADTVNSVLRIVDTKQCISADTCPEAYPLRFNNDCYKDSCPPNSYNKTQNICTCTKAWYYTDIAKTIKYCMSQTECPASNSEYQYQKIENNECVKKIECEAGEFYSFNYKCYKGECPKSLGTINSGKQCVCNQAYGYWYKETNGYLTCGLNACPDGKNNVVIGTKECVHDCSQSDKKYHFINTCQSSCPSEYIDGFELISSGDGSYTECIYRTLKKASSKANLAKIVSEDLSLYYTNDTISSYVYQSTSYNTYLQIYGINKNKMRDAEIVKRTDLSYVNISQCINRIYSSLNLSDDENVIVVKYDVMDTAKTYIINSVEYEFYRSKTYEKIQTTICEPNSIVISYPVAYTVNKYDGTSNQEYNPYKKIFNLAKELYAENKEYDVYNSSSPIYTDPCITCEIDGKDLVLEDRANYLYPAASTCENNCSFANTDYEIERINCICSPKETFDIDRKQPSMNYNFSIDEIKDNQGGSSNLPVLSCFSKLDEKDKIAKNGAFYYMVFASAAELILVVISGVMGYAGTVAKIGEGLQIGQNIITTNSNANPPPKDGYNNGPNNQIGQQYIDSRSNLRDDKQNQQANQNNNNNNNYNNNNRGGNQRQGNDDLITIKKISPDKKRGISNKKMAIYDEKQEEEEKEEKEDKDSETSSNEKDISSAESLFKELKDEQRLFRFPYQKAIRIDKNSAMIMILSSIFDKIYFTKTFLFLRKYDVLSAYISLYVLFHVLLLTVMAFFFDVKTIKKIWNEKDFPGLGWHLLYGFITYIIVWFVYKILSCLLANNDKIENLLGLKYNVEKREYLQNKKGVSIEELLYQRYQKVLSQIKTKLIIYYIICFLLIIFSFLYLTVFCAIYTGTKKRVFKAYGICLIEVLIIKIAYGIILGAMRKVSIDSKVKTLYKIARVCNIYLS